MVIYIAIAVVIVIAAILIYICRKKKKRKEEMAQGIQIYNASGKLIFDLANRTSYALGSGQTGTADGSLSDSRIVAGKTWVAVTSAPADALIPIFTIANGKISWDFYMHAGAYDAVKKRNLTFIYGVF